MSSSRCLCVQTNYPKSNHNNKTALNLAMRIQHRLIFNDTNKDQKILYTELNVMLYLTIFNKTGILLHEFIFIT
jgi:hypothetical protein